MADAATRLDQITEKLEAELSSRKCFGGRVRTGMWEGEAVAGEEFFVRKFYLRLVISKVRARVAGRVLALSRDRTRVGQRTGI